MRAIKQLNLVPLILTATFFNCACPSICHSSQAEKAKGSLRISTFKSDVTLPLGQFLYTGPLKTVEHPLLAKGIVIDDDGRRYVLCAVDWCTMRNSTYDAFREKLAAAVGTGVSDVAVQCVHLHTAPSHDASGEKILLEHEGAPRCRDLDFLDEVTDRLAAAAKKSLGHLQPVDRIGTGQAKVDRVASSRRIVENGKFYGRMSSTKDAKLQALPEGFIDPMLKTITLAQGDRPLVRLHYYATHPQSFYGDGRASWDVVGIARERLETEEGVFQIYFTGCAGDVAMGKYNDGTRRARGELSARLYKGMASASAATELVPIGSLCWRTVEIVLPPKTTGQHDPAKNEKILSDGSANDLDRFRAASRLACMRRLTSPIELSSLQIGDVYIVHLPGEPMVAFQQFAQNARAHDFVAVAGYGEGAPSYICTEAAFKEGGYEPGASAVQPCCEIILRKAVLELLGSNITNAQ